MSLFFFKKPSTVNEEILAIIKTPRGTGGKLRIKKIVLFLNLVLAEVTFLLLDESAIFILKVQTGTHTAHDSLTTHQ